MASRVLEMDSLKTSLMLFTVLDNSNTAPVSTTSHHDYIANIKLDELGDFVSLKVQFDGVVCPNEWIRVANGPSIKGVKVRDTLLPKLNRANLAELPLGFVIPDRVEAETTLGIIQQTEVLICLWNRHNIHETSRVSLVSPNFAINKNMPLHQNSNDFTVCQSILQPVTDDKDQGQTLPRLVWSRRRLRRESTAKLVKHPMLGSIEPLQVLLQTSCHVCVFC